MSSIKKLRVTLVRSRYGRRPNHRACVRALGLRRIGQTVSVEDNPCVRGVIRTIRYLLSVEAADAS